MEYNPDSHKDPDQEMNEIKKLKYLKKRETKAAVRELKKDNQFLAEVALKERKEKDKGKKKKFLSSYQPNFINYFITLS